MKVLSSNSFASKITTVVLLASSVAIGTLVMALLVFDWMSSTTLLRDRLVTLADVIGQNSTAALVFNDQPAAGEVLQALRREPPIVSACLYDLSNHLFAEYRKDSESPSCSQTKPEPAAPSHKYSIVIRPVHHENELVGTLSLTSDLHELEKRQDNLLLVGGILAFFALAIGGIFGVLLQRRISKPILDLSQAMREVTDGQNFAARVEIAGSDEIAQLGVGFNTMLSELERREREKRRAEEELQLEAHTDALTGLPNRRLFMERLSQALLFAQTESRTVGLLYIDLDGFKLVNDSLGHSLGDLLLVEVGERLQSSIREPNTLARVGGDEFTVILTACGTKEDAAALADRVLSSFNQPFLIEGHEITIGASIGISMMSDDNLEGCDLLRQADNAMYAAKRNGKNQAMFFRPELGLVARERLNLENQLRGAISRGELKNYYQPEFDVRSGRLVRFEALARWLHPTLGMIPPVKFIPIAEESGLIHSIGAYLMELACQEALNWQLLSPYPVQVAVNISSIQFNRDNIVEEISDILTRTGLRPDLLQIELTETVMVGSPERSAEKMRRLRALGVSLAIDDFGTGYSCLSYLTSLPFQVLKVDRSFVKELGSKREVFAMVRSLIGLAHNMDMRVIVEGIEEPAQLDLIRQLAADEVQGFLLGRPSPQPILRLKQLFQEEQISSEISADLLSTEQISGSPSA